MSFRRIASALIALVLFCGGVYAQSTTGTLFGIVSDPSDAPLPGAQIDIKNVATGAVTSTGSGAEGIFRFNSLVPATYELSIRATQGFKTYTQSGIDVTA